MVEDSRDMSEVEQANSPPPGPSVSPCNGDNATNVIDIELLMTEVEKHPNLYNKAHTNAERVGRQKEWAEVCKALFSQWDKFPSRKKIEKIREVQSKWQKLRETFLKGLGGVKKLTASAKKKRQQRKQSMTMLSAPDFSSNVDMATRVFPTNNNDVYDPALVNVNLSAYEEPQAIMTEAIPVPSTSAQAADFARAYEIKKKPFFIPPPHFQEPVVEPSSNPNIHFVLMLVPLLNQLSLDQQFEAWASIQKVLRELLASRKINVLQNELKYQPPVQVPSNLVQHYHTQGSGNLAPHYPTQIQVAAGLDHTYPAQEEALPLVQQIPPADHGRPTNEQGEIMYPETDQEDLDEV